MNPFQATASKLVSFLCREIKPRYHFCAINGTHYECAPFRMPKDETTQFELCTRFISLADVGNANKAKYIYALSLKPVDKSRLLDLVQKTTNEIPCPFIGLDLGGAVSKNETVGSLGISFNPQIVLNKFDPLVGKSSVLLRHGGRQPQAAGR